MKLLQSALTIILLFFITQIYAQRSSPQLTMGAGASIIKFTFDEAQTVGDLHIFQIPKISFSYPIVARFAFTADASFNFWNFIDTREKKNNFINNWIDYSSVNIGIKYHFVKNPEYSPYVVAGAGFINRKDVDVSTTSLNVGLGLTYWLSSAVGINGQGLAKITSEELIPTHFEFQIGFVFNISQFINGSRGGPRRFTFCS